LLCRERLAGATVRDFKHKADARARAGWAAVLDHRMAFVVEWASNPAFDQAVIVGLASWTMIIVTANGAVKVRDWKRRAPTVVAEGGRGVGLHPVF
jgi:hypothetical protein